jgi:alpha-D-ribose 1-methylphosphonate 5-triphosphate synthase subunit PhnL
MGQVTLRGLRKSCDAIEVMRGIDLDVRQGEFMVFVGPSGCRKSTTRRINLGDRPVAASAQARRNQWATLRPGATASVWCLGIRLEGLHGVTELLPAKVAAHNCQHVAGHAAGVEPDASWTLAFDAAGRSVH